jgi:hypothetical protein
MLYISHLSFHTIREDDEPWHGYFTCVVESTDVEAALDKTRSLVLKLRAEEDVLEDVDAVFLESCVEVHAVPEEGFMTSLQEWDGEADSSIVTSVRGAGDEHAVAYGWMPDENEEQEPAETGEGEQDGAGGEFDEPFIEF